MRILKIKGKSESIIHDQIKKEYGERVIIISTNEEKGTGFWDFFKKPSYIVTIAVDDEEVVSSEGVPSKEGEVIGKQDEKIIVGIKEELVAVRREVAEVKRMTYMQQIKDEKVSYQHSFSSIVESLKEEGVHEEVISEILAGSEEMQSAEEIAVTLYNNILSLLPVPKDNEDKKNAIFFIGSTGVGKTTTIAKLTAEYVLGQQRCVTLLTADTYRIAAIEQLKTYADILDVPIQVIYSEDDLEAHLEKCDENQLILIDTAGRSHKNQDQVKDMEKLLKKAPRRQVYLVINISTNYKDVKKIIDTYRAFIDDFQLIVTKLDETDAIGHLMNIAAYASCPIAYITTGQNVPDDIEAFNPDEYVKKLLGRIKYE